MNSIPPSKDELEPESPVAMREIALKLVPVGSTLKREKVELLERDFDLPHHQLTSFFFFLLPIGN